MYASAIHLLLSRSGYAGAELLRRLAAPDEAANEKPQSRGSLFSKFVQRHAPVARAWVGASSSAVGGLGREQLDALIAPQSIASLAAELRSSEADVVRILNNALFQAVQLSAPDGERVSEQALKHLDAELISAVRTASSAS